MYDQNHPAGFLMAQAASARKAGDADKAARFEASAKRLMDTLADDPDDAADPAQMGFDGLGKSEDGAGADGDADLFDAEALEKAIAEATDIGGMFEGAGLGIGEGEDVPSAIGFMDDEPALALAKSMDATDMVGGLVSATVASIDRVADRLAPQAAAVERLAKSLEAVGHGTVALAQHADSSEALVKSLAETVGAVADSLAEIRAALKMPAQRKGVQAGQRMPRPLVKGGEAGGGGEPLGLAQSYNPTLLKGELLGLFDRASDAEKPRIGAAINAVSGGNPKPGLDLLQKARTART